MSAASKWLPFTLIGLSVVLVVVAFALPRLVSSQSTSISAPVPARVAGLSLLRKATGSAALRGFTRLQGKSFTVLSGAKAVYGTANKVTIWAAGTATVTVTRKLLEEMGDAITDKIAEGAVDRAATSRAPFRPSGVRKVANREVYALDGMGQRKFSIWEVTSLAGREWGGGGSATATNARFLSLNCTSSAW